MDHNPEHSPITQGESGEPVHSSPPPAQIHPVQSHAGAPAAVVPASSTDDRQLLPAGGFAGLKGAVWDLLESYGWSRWFAALERAKRESDDKSDLLSPMYVFAMRLKKRNPERMGSELNFLLILLTAPFVLEIVVQLVAPAISAFAGMSAAEMIEGLQYFYAAGPFLLAMLIITGFGLSNAVPVHEHSKELICMTHMRPLSLIYGCWAYYIVHLVLPLTVLLTFVLARYLMWGTSLVFDLGVLVTFAICLLFFSGDPVSFISDATAKDVFGVKPKPKPATFLQAISGFLPLIFMYVVNNMGFFFGGSKSSRWHIDPDALPLGMLAGILFFAMPWVVMGRLLNAAEPLRRESQNYLLPRRLTAWGVLAGGAVAGLLSGWPAWFTMIPGVISVLGHYVAAAPPAEKEMSPAVHAIPFQGYGLLWKWFGRLGYNSWESRQFYILFSFWIYVALGLIVHFVNGLWVSTTTVTILAFRMTPPAGLHLLIAIMALWNILVLPLAVMRLILPKSGFYKNGLVWIHGSSMAIYFGIVIAHAQMHIRTMPSYLNFLALPTVFFWFLGNTPDIAYLMVITPLFTLLAGLHLWSNMDRIVRLENEARNIRAGRPEYSA